MTNNRWTNLGDWTIHKQVALIICEANSSIPQGFPVPPSLYKRVNVYTDPTHHAIYLKTLSRLLVILNRSNYVSSCLLHSLGNNRRKNYVSIFNATIVFLNIFFGGCLNYGHTVSTVSKFCIAMYTKPFIIKRASKIKLTWCFSKLRIPCTLVPNIT